LKPSQIKTEDKKGFLEWRGQGGGTFKFESVLDHFKLVGTEG